MEIRAGTENFEVASITPEGSAIRIALEGGITDAQLQALAGGVLDISNGYAVYAGYTKLLEHSVLLGKPDKEEVADMKTALEMLGLKHETTWADAAANYLKPVGVK